MNTAWLFLQYECCRQMITQIIEPGCLGRVEQNQGYEGLWTKWEETSQDLGVNDDLGELAKVTEVSDGTRVI